MITRKRNWYYVEEAKFKTYREALAFLNETLAEKEVLEETLAEKEETTAERKGLFSWNRE